MITRTEIIRELEKEYFETEEQIQGGFTLEMIAILEKEYGKTTIKDIYKMISDLVKKENNKKTKLDK